MFHALNFTFELVVAGKNFLKTEVCTEKDKDLNTVCRPPLCFDAVLGCSLPLKLKAEIINMLRLKNATTLRKDTAKF